MLQFTRKRQALCMRIFHTDSFDYFICKTIYPRLKKMEKEWIAFGNLDVRGEVIWSRNGKKNTVYLFQLQHFLYGVVCWKLVVWVHKHSFSEWFIHAHNMKPVIGIFCSQIFYLSFCIGKVAIFCFKKNVYTEQGPTDEEQLKQWIQKQACLKWRSVKWSLTT